VSGSSRRSSRASASKPTATKIDIVEKVMVDLTKRFAARPGGYTRIIKVGNSPR
jgi:ribosomal protein L17